VFNVLVKVHQYWIKIWFC